MTADDATPRPSRPLRADARRNYDAILTAARAAFAQSGVSTSLDEIARSAGVGPGTLYRRFPTREALLAAALADNMRAVGERGRALSSSEDPFEALTEWLGLLVEQIGTYGGLPDTVLDAARHGGSALGADCDTMTELTGTLLDRAKAGGTVRPDVTRDELFDLASAVAWIATRESRAGTRLLELALHGVAAGPRRAAA